MDSFNEIVRGLNNGDFINFKSTSNKTGNTEVVFTDKNGNHHIARVFYDPTTNKIWPEENFDDFIRTYRENIREITSKTMLKNMGEIEQDIIDANICWAVTDNINALLAIGKPQTIESNDPKILIPFIKDQLSQNKLLIILQDPNESDHWFALIGQDGLVHLVEHSPNVCNFSETFTLDILLNRLNNILIGREPDRFYGIHGNHIFNVFSYSRKPLWSKTVQLYLREF